MISLTRINIFYILGKTVGEFGTYTHDSSILICICKVSSDKW